MTNLLRILIVGILFIVVGSSLIVFGDSLSITGGIIFVVVGILIIFTHATKRLISILGRWVGIDK